MVILDCSRITETSIGTFWGLTVEFYNCELELVLGMSHYLHHVQNTYDTNTAGRKFLITVEFDGAIASHPHDHCIGVAWKSHSIYAHTIPRIVFSSTRERTLQST